MPIDFFGKEVEKAQSRFNETYGGMVVCSLKHRQAAILSIVNLNFLCRKITTAKKKDEVRDDIQAFIRTRNTLNIHFKSIERRNHGSSDGHPRCTNDGTGNSQRGRNHMQKLREHLPQHMAKGG